MSTTTRDPAHREGRDTGALRDVLRFEAEQRLRVTAVVAVVLSLFGAMYVWIGPEIVAGSEVQQMIEAFPPAMTALFGFESLGSIEGLLASEFYSVGWVVGLGGYVAYSAAGSVAGDLANDRMDVVLAAPVSRTSVLLGKYLALLVPVLVVNAVVPAALYAASVLVDEPVAVTDLATVHLLSIPYLLVWGAVGLLLGVVVRRGRTAGRAAIGCVFAAWLVESFLTTTDYAWVGAVSPTRYYDPPAVLVHGAYDVAGAGLLLVAAVALVAVSRARFRRADL